MHKVVREWGLQGKMFEVEWEAGENAAIERQIVELRQRMETLKGECTHPEHLQRLTYHQFKQDWGVSYWETSECANCLKTVRSRDETYTYRNNDGGYY